MAFDRDDPDWAKISKGDLIYGINKGAMGEGRQNYLLRPEFKVCDTIDEYNVIMLENKSGKISKFDRDAFVLALSNHPKYQPSVNGEYTNANVRIKDKGGILWAVNNRKRVHFVLDGLNIEEVVKKNFGGKNPDRDATETKPKNRAITGAELRWIYRNRHNLNVKKNVQFWFAYTPVEPPWVSCYTWGSQGEPVKHDGAALWAQYVPRRAPQDSTTTLTSTLLEY